jgi:hypothetical protein
VKLRAWYVGIAIMVGAAIYAVTLFMGVYVIGQGHTLEGILVLALAACAFPLIIGWLRIERRRSVGRNA